MQPEYSADDRQLISAAIRILNECGTAEDVYALVEEFHELQLDYECVGTIAVGRLGQLGVHSDDERYKNVERFFGFKTVDDYHAASWEEKSRWFTSPTLRIETPPTGQ